ncbi:unnamed protein product [Ambrosiozyma monospora]|uniref:Unnamed protein product n=1 Tax=Ambrosiozyma monospora TaxID=43982 RepID=A0ACB5U3I4_AMBMO|nr:unnamed protein product [Ambrosiozyma monospora]
MLGHESKGSLLFNFKEKGWANGLSAGNVNISPGYSDFVIEVEFTSKGLKHYEEIIQDIFKFIKMLQLEGPKEWVFNELRDQALSSFKFRQKTGASNTASKLAGALNNLQYYDVPTSLDDGVIDLQNGNLPELKSVPPKYLLSTSLLRDYQPGLICKFMSYLNPKNFRTLLVAKDVFDEVDFKDIQKEQWFEFGFGLCYPR